MHDSFLYISPLHYNIYLQFLESISLGIFDDFAFTNCTGAENGSNHSKVMVDDSFVPLCLSKK